MQEICKFFNVQNSHELEWAHGVNDYTMVENICADDHIMLVEGDVMLPQKSTVPMMASPFRLDGVPQAGKLPFSQWLQMLDTHRKGVKVDFLHAECLEPVLNILTETQPEVPVILHADVFNLLGDSSTNFEPEMFVQISQRMFPSATLSLGWSLTKEQDSDGKMESLIIEQMTDLILNRLGGVSYTIELRAGYTRDWEKGAAFIFEPIDGVERPDFGDNVVDGITQFRSHLFAMGE